MDIKITNNTRNELLSRNEIGFTATYDGSTPTRIDIGAKIAALQNVPVNNLVLSPLESKFGSRSISGVARIYDTPELLKSTEREYLIKRGQSQKAEDTAVAAENNENNS